MLKLRLYMCLCLLFLSLIGCVHGRHGQGDAQEQRKVFWGKPPTMTLARGIQTGWTPSQTWRVLCRRWSFGGLCHPLRKVVHPTLVTSLIQKSDWRIQQSIYEFKERGRTYPCRHFFFYKSKGLDTIRSICKVHERRQLHHFVAQIRKKYGRATSIMRLRGRRVLVWLLAKKKKRLTLQLKGRRGLSVEYKDMRLEWTRFVSKIKPSIAHVTPRLWQVWQTVPNTLKEEVLEVLSRVTYRFHLFVQRTPLLRLPSSQWTVQRLPLLCSVVPKQDWKRNSRSVWSKMGLSPKRPLRLKYKWSLLSSSLFSRSFVVHAKGCGFHFSLRLDQNGRRVSLHAMKVRKGKDVQNKRRK